MYSLPFLSKCNAMHFPKIQKSPVSKRRAMQNKRNPRRRLRTSAIKHHPTNSPHAQSDPKTSRRRDMYKYPKLGSPSRSRAICCAVHLHRYLSHFRA
ncbi:hypothetical protein BDZ45DRAFT_511265 [Acephala macrosclerotiorum]|nr:hypothetical protein BDZ45DRAFT_511265 [Acephala macrosclerotiorum]